MSSRKGVTMGREIIKSPNGSNVVVEYGNEIARNILKSKALPPTRQAIVDFANTGVTISRVLIEVRDQISLSLQYINAQGRIIREDIIPVVAVASAHQGGREALRSMDIDEDIYNDAMNDLDEKRQKRRRSY
jgi:hypothetical protein